MYSIRPNPKGYLLFAFSSINKKPINAMMQTMVSVKLFIASDIIEMLFERNPIYNLTINKAKFKIMPIINEKYFPRNLFKINL